MVSKNIDSYLNLNDLTFLLLLKTATSSRTCNKSKQFCIISAIPSADITAKLAAAGIL